MTDESVTEMWYNCTWLSTIVCVIPWPGYQLTNCTSVNTVIIKEETTTEKNTNCYWLRSNTGLQEYKEMSYLTSACAKHAVHSHWEHHVFAKNLERISLVLVNVSHINSTQCLLTTTQQCLEERLCSQLKEMVYNYFSDLERRRSGKGVVKRTP